MSICSHCDDCGDCPYDEDISACMADKMDEADAKRESMREDLREKTS